jgi:hypothetical protein
MILPPSRPFSEPEQIGASDEVMVAYFAPPRPGEDPRVVRVGLGRVLEAVGFLVVDPLQGKPGKRPHRHRAISVP